MKVDMYVPGGGEERAAVLLLVEAVSRLNVALQSQCGLAEANVIAKLVAKANAVLRGTPDA